MINMILGALVATCVSARMSPQEKQLVESGNEFAGSMYRELIKNLDAESNILFSPLSVSTLMSMVLLGASGQTADQIHDVLGYDKVWRGNVHSIHKRFVHELLTSLGTSDGSIETANSIFGDEGLRFLPSYLNNTKQYYRTLLQQMDFANKPEDSRKIINNWVSNRTHGHIINMLRLGSITPETLLVVVNAVYFKGQWEKPFDAENTTRMQFHITPNRTVMVDMMHIQAHLGLEQKISGHFDLLELPYEGNTGFYIILPRQGVSLATVEEQLNITTLNSIMDNLNAALRVEAWIPKFQFTQSFSLAEKLISLGIKDLFDAAKSDLSNMTSRKASLEDVYHKTAIELNEEGTVASGGTGAVFFPISEESPFGDIPFKADRPFLFLIREKLTRSILFMGRFALPGNGQDRAQNGAQNGHQQTPVTEEVIKPISSETVDREHVNPPMIGNKNPIGPPGMAGKPMPPPKKTPPYAVMTSTSQTTASETSHGSPSGGEVRATYSMTNLTETNDPMVGAIQSACSQLKHMVHLILTLGLLIMCTTV